MSEPSSRRRRGRTSGRTVAPHRSAVYRHLRHPFAPQSVFSDDEIASLHDTALRVLQELGLRILLPEAREIFAAAGAIVREDTVYIGRDIVTGALATAPSGFTLNAANPDRALSYAPGSLIFKAGAGCPNASDLERGRRPGTLEAFEETLKLCQSFDVIHSFGPCVEPQDVPIQFRHYAMTRAQLTLGDKPMFVYARGRGQVEEAFELIRIGLNLSDDDFADGIWASTNINTNSPRLIDRPMAQGIIDFARAGQMAVVTPFCLAGAMAPVTVAGALTLQHAEALAGISLSQLARPGAPVSYGGFSSNVDMKSGSPAFGTPEMTRMQIGSGQLARLIGLPWRSAAGSASNAPDMQAANENDLGLWGCMMSNATLVVHAAGWLEGGLSFGYEKFINDVEAMQFLAEMCVKPSGTSAEIGWEALADVQPGGHFFATQHTMDRYQTAFYAPLVADLQDFGGWEVAGCQSSAQRATAIWKQTLADFSPAPTGAQAKDRLVGYIEQRIAAGGAELLD